jgi:hypothetical protein
LGVDDGFYFQGVVRAWNEERGGHQVLNWKTMGQDARPNENVWICCARIAETDATTMRLSNAVIEKESY